MSRHANDPWIRIGLLACLLMLVPSSSFCLSQYLTKQITTDEYTKIQLNFALQQNNYAALQHAWQQSTKHSDSWLLLAKKLAKRQGQAAYQLAGFYLEKKSISQAIVWYQQAIRLEFPPAFVALAQYYFDLNNFTGADDILAQLAKVAAKFEDQSNTLAAQILRINLAVNRGDINVVKQSIAGFTKQLINNKQGRLLLDNISKYQVLSVSDNNKNAATCANSIQLFATRFAHLQRLEQLIKGVEQYALKQTVCFAPVRYIAINALACRAEAAQAIQCNEQHWQHLAESINTRFVGAMLPEGGANVHLGALYIDVNDNIDVLVHEISHLLGFVDEYPLAKDHVACKVAQEQAFSENIAVLASRYQGSRADIRAKILLQLAWGQQIKASTPILQLMPGQASLTPQQWWLGTPKQFADEVGIFTAQTCDNTVNSITVNDNTVNNNIVSDNLSGKSHYSAYKPLAKSTKMQYFSLVFPPEYLSFLQEGAFQFLMPSFHYNIALAHFQQGNLTQANFWLKRSALWESKQGRREKVLQGSF